MSEPDPKAGSPIVAPTGADPAARAVEPTDPITPAPHNGSWHYDPSGTVDLGFLGPSHDNTYLGVIDTYRVVSLVGAGGMGLVLKAHDPALDRILAIKVLAAHLSADRSARERLFREARAAASIRHPNVVVVHGIGECGSMPYIVMEYVEGRPLKARIESGAGFSNREFVRVGLQIAAGLDAAHRRGVVHRDVKPANILIEEETGLVKVADFGLALPTERPGEPLTTGYRLLGTPPYMSPEQVRGEPLDARSDLFSLGSVFYAMATGAPPFHGRSTLDTIRRVESETPRPLRAAVPDVHPEISDLVERLLRKDPAERCQSAAEVRAWLERIVLSPADDAPLKPHPAPRPLAPESGPRPAGSPGARRPRRIGLLLTALALMILLGTAPLWWPALITSYSQQPPGGKGAQGPPEDDPPPPIKSSGVITVGGAGADFGRLREALAAAGPGATIQILDGSLCEGPFHIGPDLVGGADGPSGLTIEGVGDELPMLYSPVEEGTVVALKDAPGVTFRRLRISAGVRQHALVVEGDASGLLLDGVEISQPKQASDSIPAAVKFQYGAAGTPERPARITNSTIQCCERGLGIWIHGEAARPASWIEIRGNRFLGAGVQLLLYGAVNDVTVERNVFLRGADSLNLNFQREDSARGVRVLNNSFFESARWIGFAYSAPRQGVEIRNNLALRCGEVGVSNAHHLADYAGGIQFSHNAWQPSLPNDWDDRREGLVARRLDDPRVTFLDPDHPDFLRPAPDSFLAVGGAGGDLPPFIGAVDPRRD